MEPKDYSEFLDLLRGEARGFLGGGECIVARAPGRIDVLGGVGDYSGAVVLEGTLAEAALAAVRLRNDGLIRLWSYGAECDGIAPRFQVCIDRFYSSSGLIGYEQAMALLAASPDTRWAGYVAGAFFVLLAEGEMARLPGGADVFIRSSVPMGAGVSSSAAIEVATMTAAAAAYGLRLDGLRLAWLCQRVENRVVGAPCGIMDQVTSALGRENELLALLCQPHEVLGTHRLPPGYQVLGIDSHVKHSVGGSRYTKARVGAFMGLAILMRETGQDFGGYLCNITPAEYRARYRALLPAKMRGADFIARYGSTPDTATTVDPDTIYSVRPCAEHAIYENARVRRFIQLLERANSTGDERAMEAAGKLMYAAHWSYGHKIALGARETDLLVSLARQAPPGDGGARILGAKITGGGSGGAVAILAKGDVSQQVASICASYRNAVGVDPHVFTGSSPGACAFGTRTVPL